MGGRVRRTWGLLAAVVVALVGGMGLAGCAGSGGGPPFEVSFSVISGEDTQEIGVWAPDAEGSWPVVIAFHGWGSSKESWDVLATELAKEGLVVFVPDYRSTVILDVKRDVGCGMRYARSVAGDYGGDLDQPYAFVGHSGGAGIAMVSKEDALEGTGGTLDACYEGLPGPDVVVAIAGCYFVGPGEDRPTTPGEDLEDMPAACTPVTLVAGENDQDCPAWQSEDAAADLEAAGYDTTLVTIPGATHGTVAFADDSQDEWPPLPADDPRGQQTVRAIVDAIEAAKS